MSGFNTPGLPAAIPPLTGIEVAAFDTLLGQGINPESEAISVDQLSAYTNNKPAGSPAIGTADNGTTQTLTAAMIAVPGSRMVVHVSTGGSTPSLTLPLMTALVAALPLAVVGTGYILRIVNTNSGTATVVTNTGWTTSGTLTLATNTWREFLVSVTSVTSATATFTSIGTGTTS